MTAITAIKGLVWGGLSRVLSAGAGLIRRQAVPFSPAHWRCLAFSFSQLGEDRIIAQLARQQSLDEGTYVDVGAFHPIQYSNTLLLNIGGWKGINIDANVAAIRLFEKLRPGDTNVCAAVSNVEQEMTYYEYPAGATNRIGISSNEPMLSVLGERPSSRSTIVTRTLDSILHEHCPDLPRIDFLNIDCEGADLQVLEGLDFKRWHPRIVAVEAHDERNQSSVDAFLQGHGYKKVASALITQIYLDATLDSAPRY